MFVNHLLLLFHDLFNFLLHLRTLSKFYISRCFASFFCLLRITSHLVNICIFTFRPTLTIYFAILVFISRQTRRSITLYFIFILISIQWIICYLIWLNWSWSRSLAFRKTTVSFFKHTDQLVSSWNGLIQVQIIIYIITIQVLIRHLLEFFSSSCCGSNCILFSQVRSQVKHTTLCLINFTILLKVSMNVWLVLIIIIC